MIAKRYDDELMYSVQKCEGDNKYKYCTRDGKLAFKKPGKDFLGVTKQNQGGNLHWRICWKIIAMEGMHHSSKTTN